MHSPVILRYEPRFLDAIAGLLAETRKRRRLACPSLAPGLSDPSTSRAAVSRFTDRDGAVAVSEDGSVEGFLFARRNDSSVFGPSVAVEIDGWAVRPGADERIPGGLYAAVFDALCRPANPGSPVPEHRINCPAFEVKLLEEWFRLGFGIEQAYAVSRLCDMDAEVPVPDGIAIRRGRPGDEEILAGLSPLIATLQSRAPVWAAAPESYLSDIREGYRGLASDSEAVVFLAFRGDSPIGFQAWFPVQEDPIDGEPGGRAVELSVAATVPEERGRGTGRALTSFGVKVASAAGYSVCFTDWRTANPHASAFWPARGFRPFAYRLVRRLDPLAFATGNHDAEI